MSSTRRFPPPWIAVRNPDGCRIDDGHGKLVAAFYGRNDDTGANDHALNGDEARRILMQIARSPGLLSTKPAK